MVDLHRSASILIKVPTLKRNISSTLRREFFQLLSQSVYDLWDYWLETFVYVYKPLIWIFVRQENEVFNTFFTIMWSTSYHFESQVTYYQRGSKESQKQEGGGGNKRSTTRYR